MIPTRFAHWNISQKSLAFASVVLLFLGALACDPPVNPNPDPPPVEIPRNAEPPNPSGTGWLVWSHDSTMFRGTLTGFTILRNTISFNITGINPDGCVPQTTFTHALNGNVFAVKAFYKRNDTLRVCTQATMPFTLRVFLTASTGTYRVVLRPTPLSRAFDTTVTVP
ncbi:MAG: hypothetical protein EAZ92_11245 [Candidatus Kapaibacterium sp.]|nr:MAG: hypothetical protein EAZ92_11245 [Candidatus Kapabacteria bacterium]